jgi:hypothetical protein
MYKLIRFDSPFIIIFAKHDTTLGHVMILS